MEEKTELGRLAEEHAAEYLASSGYTILHRNWRFGHKEIDIICTDGKELVVVEVKGRKRQSFIPPEDLLTIRQERFLVEAAEEYLYQFNVKMPVRFDLFSLIQKSNGISFEHYRDAIIPGLE